MLHATHITIYKAKDLLVDPKLMCTYSDSRLTSIYATLWADVGVFTITGITEAIKMAGL